jgi:NTE family protein
MEKYMKTVSLVLGSGGARGLAHIGVIHWLEENGYEIRSISGCSVGAMIGGIYAAGKLDEFEQWVRPLTKLDILTLLDMSWSRNGLVQGDKIIESLVELVGDQTIEELPIPFTAVAADINNEKEVWMNSGSLFDAIRASISLPLFFTPYDHKGIKLIDGGVLNPVPIAPTFSDDTQMTIAVNLGGPLESIKISKDTQKTLTKESETFHQKISNFIDNLKQNIQEEVEQIDLGVFDIANQAFDAMQSTIARQKLAAYPPDHTIEIARNACGTLEFDRADEMIALGYKKAKECFA